MIASVLAALVAAGCFASAAVLQQEAARTTSSSESLRLSLLIELLRRPKWVAGVAMLIAGYGFQALALAYGPVALVQPVVVTELAIAIPLAMWRRHRKATVRDWIGIAAVLVGVSSFLAVASPAAGITNPGVLTWVASLTPVAGAIAATLVLAVPTHGPRRAMLLGAAAGMSFALLAVITKSATGELSSDLAGAFLTWQPYALVAVGIGALVVSQSAYQAGPLAFSMPMVAVLEPLAAVLIGDLALEEEVRLSAGFVALEAVSASSAAVGIVLLATSPTVLSIYRDDPDQGKRPERSLPGRSGGAGAGSREQAGGG